MAGAASGSIFSFCKINHECSGNKFIFVNPNFSIGFRDENLKCKKISTFVEEV